MAIADDISVAVNGDIRYTGTTDTYTVLELHRFLQDLADDAVASGNDLLDITDTTPSDRSTDNIITLLAPYNIDDTLAEKLYDGSIEQDGGDTLYSGLVVLGSVETGTQLQIVQDNALVTNYWGTGLNDDAAQNILLRIMLKTRVNGADIDGKRIRVQAREWTDTYAEFSATLGQGNSVAAVSTANDLNNQNTTGNVSGWSVTNTEGYQLLDLAGDGSADEPYYGQWNWVSAPVGSNNKANDIYEYTKYIQRRGTAETIHGINGELFRGITHDVTHDNRSGTFVEDEILAWGTKFDYENEATAQPSLGEYVSFSPSGAVGKLVYLDDQGLTGTMVIQRESGSGTITDADSMTGLTSGFTADITNATVTGGADSGGSGLLLADDTTDQFFIQLLTGSAPTDNQILTGSTNGATADVNVTVTSRTISPTFVGTSTGSAIIGAYGISFDSADTTASDQFFDLTNSLVTPPNNVTFTVSGLEVGEDRVLVGPEDAGGLHVAQLSLDTALTTDNITSVVVTEAEPDNTPSTGTIRVVDDAGKHRLLTYDGITGSGPTTFSITTTDGNEDFLGDEAAIGNDVYITYIDKLAGSADESVTLVFDSADTFFVRVRDGGTAGDLEPIKTFETTAGLGSGGGSATAIRTSDA